MKKLLLQGASLAFMIFICAKIHAQSYDESYGVQNLALSNQSAVIANSFTATGNPALIAENKKCIIGLSVSNRFFLTNLKQGGFGVNYKLTKTDALGLIIQFDGTVNFKQNTIALAYAKKLNEKLYAGISFIYLNTFEQSIESKNNLIAKVGILIKPNKQFSIGATVYNPFMTKLSSITKERIPTYFTAGIRYKLSTQLNVYSEFKLGLNEVRNLKAGLTYEPNPGIIFYIGFQNSNSPLSFGLSYKTKSITLLMACQYHQVLGFSPVLGGELERE